jgi:ATP-dependent DNA helicase RecG
MVDIMIRADGKANKIFVTLTEPIGSRLGLRDIPTCHEDSAFSGLWNYSFSLSPVVALSVRDVVTEARRNGAVLKYHSDEDKAILKEVVAKNTPAELDWDEDKSLVRAVFPQTERYRKIMRSTYATPRGDGAWTLPITSAPDLLALNETLPRNLRFTVSDTLYDVVHEPIPQPYDGSAESLRMIPTSALRIVRSNIQSWSLRRDNRASIQDKLKIMGINSLYDLIMIRPRRYIDRSNPQDVRDLIEGETATIVGMVAEWKHPSTHLSVMVVEDKLGAHIQCSFFNAGRWFEEHYKPGDEVIVTGQYKPWHASRGFTVDQIVQPQVDPVEAAGVMPIMPVYFTPGKAALSSMILVHCEQELMSRLGDEFRGPRWADPALKANGITDVSYGKAIKTMHFPRDTNGKSAAEKALAFCEIVQLLVWIEAHRRGSEHHGGVRNSSDHTLTNSYIGSLPYHLTGAQERADAAILRGMDSDKPLHALLVGDVGSGKTTVMHLAALNAVNAGHQAVICAPTEILATQLYEVFMKILSSMPDEASMKIHPVLHAGYKGKGSTKRRNETIESVRDGSTNLIFGTHSVLNLEYHDLSFVGVDEQHKFGAAQRSRLLDVRTDGKTPDFLMQTATPIPRSMAQVYYGDVEYLALDELPAGRQPIKTVWVRKKGASVVEDRGSEIWSDVLSEVRRGHGAFIVCPMVSDSEKIDAASVRKTAKELEAVFPRDVAIASVYGGQVKDKQDAAITGFKDGRISVLVASSVVEVGVSCELATRMVILDANRFGLASLHQIRGRIGRSDLPSKCWLVAMPFNDAGSSRMQAMCDTLDGWTLSKTDLKNRGTGSLFGTAQSGRSDLMFANLVRDAKWIAPARMVAKSILKSTDSERAVEDAGRYFDIKEDQDILS